MSQRDWGRTNIYGQTDFLAEDGKKQKDKEIETGQQSPRTREEELEHEQQLKMQKPKFEQPDISASAIGGTRK